MKIALLIVDMQKSLLNDVVDQRKIDSACEYINHVAGRLRSNRQTVIHVQDVEGAEELPSGSLDFIPQINVEPGDIHIAKTYSNAFWNTDLDNVLKANDIGFVIISGFAAEQCVLFTYNGALERGYKAAILQRGFLSTQNDAVDATYRDRQIVSYSVIDFMLQQNRREQQ
ncbi:cysteine hydrolase family protein [Paenibacillus thermotolerans]|uniref:cysteine hydrolase family protein n=1 Tax=Paenibacillus thermotolerans TaxID=3027807 RepID=UPI002368E635|nr:MULTISPECIES: isochorismatase family cysteine hydrolase [unclassified Paenibacillus]